MDTKTGTRARGGTSPPRPVFGSGRLSRSRGVFPIRETPAGRLSLPKADQVKLRQVNRGPPSNRRSDPLPLLVEEKRSQKDAAEAFGVTEAAISKRVKALNLDLSRHVGLERAKVVADHGLDVVAQLQRINRAIGEELEWALGEARQPGADRKGLQGVVVDLTSEIRKQLGLQLDIVRALTTSRRSPTFSRRSSMPLGSARRKPGRPSSSGSLRDGLFDQLLASLAQGDEPLATDEEYWRWIRAWGHAHAVRPVPLLGDALTRPDSATAGPEAPRRLHLGPLSRVRHVCAEDKQGRGSARERRARAG